jgi:TPR repeat protein
MTSFSTEQVPWTEQQDYVLSAKLTAITLLVVVALWLLYLLVLKILGLFECNAGTTIVCKEGKKTQTDKPKKLTSKDMRKRLDALVKKLEEELKGADLFAPLPPTEDCAICLVPFSRLNYEIRYMACCGNEICRACYKENEESINKQNEEKNAGKKLAFTCPFCREPNPTCFDEVHAQLQARCLKNDHIAFTKMGDIYRRGEGGIVRDYLKALDCYIRAVELGSPAACTQIGGCYFEGHGLSVNEEKSAFFGRVGALRGSLVARYNVGVLEYYDLGNHEIAIRHWKIAAEAGDEDSLNKLWDIYADLKLAGRDFITEEYLSFASRACHDARMEVWSEEREKHQSEELTVGPSTALADLCSLLQQQSSGLLC